MYVVDFFSYVYTHRLVRTSPRQFYLKSIETNQDQGKIDEGLSNLTSCRWYLRFLVFEPQTDHAESCEIMADHSKSCPWKCLKMPHFASKCPILLANAGILPDFVLWEWLKLPESTWCPESPRTKKLKLVLNDQWSLRTGNHWWRSRKCLWMIAWCKSAQVLVNPS